MVVDPDIAARFADSDSPASDRRLNIRYPDIWIRDGESYDVNRVRDHILLIVEVTSGSTIDVDITDKRIQYAAAGIPRYLIVGSNRRKTGSRRSRNTAWIGPGDGTWCTPCNAGCCCWMSRSR